MKRCISILLFSFLSIQMYSVNSQDTIVQAKEDRATSLSLQKTKAEVEKLHEEIISFKRNNDINFFKWLSENSGAWTTLLAIISAILAFWKYQYDKNKDRNIRIEENFKSIIENLDSQNLNGKVQAVSSLSIYCDEDHKAYHKQVLQICIANLKREEKTINHTEEEEEINQIDSLFINCFENAIKAYLNPKKKSSLSIWFERLFNKIKNLWEKLTQEEKIPQEEFPINMTRLKLDSINLSGLNLDGFDLSFSSLKYAKLRNTTLKRMKGFKTDFSGADLSGANLQEAKLQKARFEKSKMEKTNLISADLKRSKLKFCKFLEAKMQSAHLELAELTGSEFNKANISDTYFSGSDCEISEIKKHTQKAAKTKNAHFKIIS